jgi:hypothetical protein
MQERIRAQLSRHPRLAVAGAIGAVVFVGVAFGLAIGVFAERPTADASPIPSPSANPSAPPSSTPPQETRAPESADDHLVQVKVDGLRMRAMPDTNAEIVRILDYGEVVRVASGTLKTADFPWYEVFDLDSRSGWVAVGDTGDPWLELVPAEPTTSALLVRLERDCDVSLRGMVGIPVVPPNVTIAADGRVVLGSADLSWPGLVRQLSPSGLAQIQRDVLELPALQESANHSLERLPNSPEPPGHGLCANRFVLSEGTDRVEVTAVAWLDQEEGVYWVASPERRALDELAVHLLDIGAWLGPDAWSEPTSSPYVAGSYQFWLVPQGGLPPPADVDAPSVTGAGWPFDGPIDQFGELVGQDRCGSLDPVQAFEVLRLMREAEVPTNTAGVDPPRPLALAGFGSGQFATDTGWFGFWLTPRSPDGYPSCAD